MNILYLIICAVGAYLLGSINSSILVSRAFGVKDIRRHGSGNAGATNTLRTVGKTAAVLTFTGDVAKAVIAVLLAKLFADKASAEAAACIAALFVALGHDFPLYFKFKGGKGIATSWGAIMMLDWRIGLIILAAAIIIIAVSRYVSLGSLAAAVLYPVITAFVYPGSAVRIITAVLMGLIAIERHKKNIMRLVRGKESKLGQRR